MLERSYRGATDLRKMQDLVAAAWQLEGPRVERHIGGLAWCRYHISGRQDDWKIRVWEERDRVVAWGWLFLPGTLDFQLHPRRRELLGSVLDWFEGETGNAERLETSVLADHAETIGVLEARGYRRARPDEPHFVLLARELEDIRRPVLPGGFAVRGTRGEEDVEQRVAVHRAAWHPSRVTVASHREVMAAYPYRPELDCVVEAPDGTFAAYCLAWLDEANGVGELEPVGTDPRFARRGLAAAAACTFALAQLARLGARTAIVYARGDDAYPGPKRLYESLGFRELTRLIPFRRAS